MGLSTEKIENQVFWGVRPVSSQSERKEKKELSLPLVPTCWAWETPGPSSFQACGHLGGSAAEAGFREAHGSVGAGEELGGLPDLIWVSNPHRHFTAVSS